MISLPNKVYLFVWAVPSDACNVRRKATILLVPTISYKIGQIFYGVLGRLEYTRILPVVLKLYLMLLIHEDGIFKVVAISFLCVVDR